MSTWRGETSGPALWPGLAAAGAVATVPCAGLVRPGLSGTTSALLTAASLRWPAPPAHPHTDGAESAASEVGCSYRTLVTTECHVEPGPDGAPVRRCEMLRRTFRQCPGRWGQHSRPPFRTRTLNYSSKVPAAFVHLYCSHHHHVLSASYSPPGRVLQRYIRRWMKSCAEGASWRSKPNLAAERRARPAQYRSLPRISRRFDCGMR